MRIVKEFLGHMVPGVLAIGSVVLLVAIGASLSGCASQVAIGGDINAPYHAARHHARGYTASERASLDELVAKTSVDAPRAARTARRVAAKHPSPAVRRAAKEKPAHIASAPEVAEAASAKPWWRRIW